jgi:hypothetical protein
MRYILAKEVSVFRLPIFIFAIALAASGQSRDQRLTSQLQHDPQNLPLILQLAALKLDQASALTADQDRASKLDEVQILYLRANALDARNVDALYHLGIISWMKVFPAVISARRETAMDPETSGPVRDHSTRAVLNARYRADIDYAIATLEQAIAIDPANNDAMAYLQMAYRARADMKDTMIQWEGDQNIAGQWREKAFEVGSAKPPTFVPALITSSATFDSEVMAKRLTHSTRATCPAGLYVIGAVPPVILSAVIERDGSVIDLERRDGPGELVDAAMEAAWQWTYQPTLLNGTPVRVNTTIEVPFVPCPKTESVR